MCQCLKVIVDQRSRKAEFKMNKYNAKIKNAELCFSLVWAGIEPREA